MTDYYIGDVQGCLDGLERLLEAIQFNPNDDRLWFAGDLVNRGQNSLGVLRLVKNLGDTANSVLGNHDLHLLAAMQGIKKLNKSLRPIAEASDSEELLDWLAARPFLIERPAIDGIPRRILTHAGIHPSWNLETAIGCAKEIETVFSSKFERNQFLMNMYGDQPDQWSEKLSGMERLRFIVNVFTRMRFCEFDGRLDMNDKGPIGSQATGLIPWFKAPKRLCQHETLIIGHWSTLGQTYWPESNLVSVDTGFLWGGALTAACYHEEAGWVFQSVKAKT